MDNADKNPIPGNKKFGKDQGQPTPEQKRAGWQRRRQAQEMMDKVREYMKMPQDKFMELLNDIKSNPSKYTVEEVLLYKYATKAFNGDKFMLDWFDRNISKAPTQLEGGDGGVIKIMIGDDPDPDYLEWKKKRELGK